jgi:hypothetical protein
MALSEKQLAAIERAKARVAEQALSFDRTYFGEDFTFEFLPTMTQPALEIVSQIQRAAGGDVIEQFERLIAFLDLMAVEGTGDLIGELARDGIMQITDIVELQQAVIAEVAGRPTMRSSSSPDGSPTSGSDSTASALPDPSIQPA